MSITECLNKGKAGIEWLDGKPVSAVITASNGHETILYHDEDLATIQYIRQLELDSLELRELKAAISTRELMDYLSEHESDIASGINDFGRLRSLFVDIFDRQPSDNLELSTQLALDNG